MSSVFRFSDSGGHDFNLSVGDNGNITFNTSKIMDFNKIGQHYYLFKSKADVLYRIVFMQDLSGVLLYIPKTYGKVFNLDSNVSYSESKLHQYTGKKCVYFLGNGCEFLMAFHNYNDNSYENVLQASIKNVNDYQSPFFEIKEITEGEASEWKKKHL